VLSEKYGVAPSVHGIQVKPGRAALQRDHGACVCARARAVAAAHTPLGTLRRFAAAAATQGV